MAKKKVANEWKEKLDNLTLVATSIALGSSILLAILFNYIQSAAKGFATVFLIVLAVLGGAAVIGFAVLGYIKKNNRLFKYSLLGVAVTIFSMAILQLKVSGIIISYIAIGIYLALIFFYYILAKTGIWEKKIVKIIFWIIASVLVLALVVYGLNELFHFIW